MATDEGHPQLECMVRELVPDAFWQRVAPLLPPPRPTKKLGRPRTDDRAALEAIVFVLRSGIPWEMLPRKQFGLSGMTAWRRLEEWTEAGVWEKLQHHLLMSWDYEAGWTSLAPASTRRPSGPQEGGPRGPKSDGPSEGG